MTTPITNRATPSALGLTSAPKAPASTASDVEAMPAASATPAATFEPAVRRAPFGPPAPPKLVDERTAQSEAGRELIRDENRAAIKQYNKDYAAYLETYKAGVEGARDLDQIRSFGRPVPYDIGATSLPVAQRAQYDELLKPSLEHAKSVRSAIGARELKELGIKTPEAYVFAEGKVGFFGQSIKQRQELATDGEGQRNKTTLGFTAKLPDEVKFAGQSLPKVGVSVDAETGKMKGTLSASAGIVGLEMDTGGKLGIDIGPQAKLEAFGQEAKARAAVGSSWDPSSSRAETSVKAGVKVGDLVEVELKAGAGAQLFSPDFVKATIDPGDKDFFDVQAKRSGGR